MALHTETVLGFVVYWGRSGHGEKERQCQTELEARALAAKHDGAACRIVATLRNGEVQATREELLDQEGAQ